MSSLPSDDYVLGSAYNALSSTQFCWRTCGLYILKIDMHAVVEGATAQCRDDVLLLGACNSMQTVLMKVHLCCTPAG